MCPSQPKHCYPICLTGERWKAIVGFAADAGLKLAFGLNLQASNLSNVEGLLRFTQKEGLEVDTFELGNELGISHIEALGAGIAALVRELWPEHAPLLAGPDDAQEHKQSINLRSHFIFLRLIACISRGDGNNASRLEFTTLAGEQSYLHAITFHAYPFHNGGGPTPSLVQHMMTPALLDQGVETYSQMIAAVKAGVKPGQAMPELWMGEGNAAGHGGRLGVTNTFINSFWYLNAMGGAASLGIARFNRQTLIGGGYELLNRTYSYSGKRSIFPNSSMHSLPLFRWRSSDMYPTPE